MQQFLDVLPTFTICSVTDLFCCVVLFSDDLGTGVAGTVVKKFSTSIYTVFELATKLLLAAFVTYNTMFKKGFENCCLLF